MRLWDLVDEGLVCRAVYRGHNESVASVCFAPKKGTFCVSASQDNTLKVWDLQAQGEVTSASMTVVAHQKYINVVKVSPNDKLIASSSQDRSVKIWNA